MEEVEPREPSTSRRHQIKEELSVVFEEDFPWRMAKQWPTAFKVTEIFFKYVSWIAIIAATKYVKDKTHDWYVGKLLFIECGFFVLSLMWLAFYLIYVAVYDADHPVGRSTVLGAVSIIFALFLLLFLSNPLLPLDRIIDRLEHRDDAGGQQAAERNNHRDYSGSKP